MPEQPRGRLYLIPVGLGGHDVVALIPPATLEVARRLQTYAAENAKSARGFLKAVGHPLPLRQIVLHQLDEHARDVEPLLALLTAGEDCGLLSEAGCPAVADPGALLVQRAHDANIVVVPLVGPSSILLAVMASGMNGQRFAFHGYLPVDKIERARRLRELEAQAFRETQIFIETPYRNAAMLQSLLGHCRGDTLLCIAADLTLPTESVATRSIAAWKRNPPALDRRLVVYLICRKKA